MYDVNGRWQWPRFANEKHDFKTCLTWPAWQDLDKGRLQEVAGKMSELHTDDNFMYENRLVGDAADKTLADSIEEMYDMDFHEQFMDALDRQPQKIEYFDSVWDAVHEKRDEDPMNKQVSGSHYNKYVIQPAEYCYKNGLNNLQSEAISYITRYPDKGGKIDIEKAIHTLEMLIHMEYEEK